MFNFLKVYQKIRLEKVSFDKYEGSLFSCLPCYLLSLLTSEILIIKRDRRKFPFQIQRLTLLLGGEKLPQVVLPGQEDWSWNNEAWGHVSSVGGLWFQESGALTIFCVISKSSSSVFWRRQWTRTAEVMALHPAKTAICCRDHRGQQTSRAVPLPSINTEVFCPNLHFYRQSVVAVNTPGQ